MNEDAATIELPDGSPGAVSDAGTSMQRVAGGFERAGSTVARASSTVGAWEGRARVSFDGRIAGYGLVLVAVEQALTAARGAVRRYETALEEARAKIRGLREQEEMAVARLTRAKGQLEEAQGRLQSAQGRMSAVSLGAGALEPYSMAEQAQARRDAADAQGDIDVAQKQIDNEREEIRDRRNDAKRERTRLVEAEQDAAAEVRAAAAQLPDVQLPGGAASPSAYAGTIFAGPLSPLARDPRWASAMAKAAQDDKPEEPGALEKAWNNAMENFGRGTPLEGPLVLGEQLSPGFREDFGRALTEDLATGLYETGKMGVQLSLGYRLIDPAGSERAARQAQGIVDYAREDPWGFAKDASGITDIEQGRPGTAFGNWSLAAIPGGAGVKALTTTGKLVPDLTTAQGARDVMLELTTNANQRLGNDISTAVEDGLLSRPEYAAGQRRDYLAPMFYGTAIERRVAQMIDRSPVLSNSLVHLGGPNQPDFTITLPNGQTVNFDITTNNELGIARHLQRPYGPGLQIIPYERPDGVVPFPPDSPPDPLMRLIENQEFTSFKDRGGNVYEDLHFRKCKFISSAISITDDPANRSVVRNVTLEGCRVQGSSLYCAVVEDVLVDGLQTSDLHQAWGAVFKHVTLTGKIGRLMTIPRLSSDSRGTPEQDALERANEEYYRGVDWALDISRCESVELDLEGIPGPLIRRDPETQIVVTRQAAMAGEWRELESVQDTHYPIVLDQMLKRNAEDAVLVADKRARRFKQLHAAIEDLRAAGVAEPD